jgi:pyruvate dehydrogenase E2 component (dihydrolipoamide acetyltransferase)/2-oxoglutarate dehydrogenase E2 component (dihydrolipoamide succinyltransferase)
MATNIIIPKLGTLKTDATLVEWKAKEGEKVEKGKVVLGIETRKIKFDIQAEVPGYLHILVKEGVKAPVGMIVGALTADPEELEALRKESPKTVETTTPKLEASASTPAIEIRSAVIPEKPHGIRISPVARKMAEENMIDITRVTATGPGGRIVKEDIEKAMAAKASAPADKPSPETEVIQEKRAKYTIPLKGMREAIAEHMHRSLSVSAQLTAMGEIDMTELIKLRQNFLAKENIIGTRITYNDIFVFIIARVLKEKPVVNSSIIENEIKVWDDINIGVAVAIEDGLIVPVIRNADRKSIAEISKISKDLVEKARTGKLMPDDVSEGTFTITNLGAAGAGWRFETSIINQPESAILGIGGITDRAVVRDGQIVIRPIMTYSFTYDHRVIDGTLAVQFMSRAIELVENPTLLLLC